MSETFTFSGEPIKQETLRMIWEETRSSLKNEYLVENISMPKIEAITLTPKRFMKAMKQLQLSPHILDMSVIEWGETAGFPSACTFFADVERKWIVLVCRELRPLEQDLKHELLHIWENALGLEWGTLTNKFG